MKETQGAKKRKRNAPIVSDQQPADLDSDVVAAARILLGIKVKDAELGRKNESAVSQQQRSTPDRATFAAADALVQLRMQVPVRDNDLAGYYDDDQTPIAGAFTVDRSATQESVTTNTTTTQPTSTPLQQTTNAAVIDLLRRASLYRDNLANNFESISLESIYDIFPSSGDGYWRSNLRLLIDYHEFCRGPGIAIIAAIGKRNAALHVLSLLDICFAGHVVQPEVENYLRFLLINIPKQLHYAEGVLARPYVSAIGNQSG
ncbi:hypothetical protein MBLNU230_g3612t1 [Neophaeotheca triangularis]